MYFALINETKEIKKFFNNIYHNPKYGLSFHEVTYGKVFEEVKDQK